MEVEGASNEFWPQKDKVRLEDWDTHPVTGGAAKEGHQGQSHLCNEALWVKTHRDRLAHSGLSVFICEPKNSVPPKGEIKQTRARLALFLFCCCSCCCLLETDSRVAQAGLQLSI